MHALMNTGGVESKTVGKLVGKLSSFMSKVSKEPPQPAPAIQNKTLRDKLTEDYIELFQKQFKKDFDIKTVCKCFFQDQVDRVGTMVDDMLNETLRKIQMWQPGVPANTYWTPYSSGEAGTF